MLRKIITIDEEKCNGCGLCVQACHEGALQMVNGKAKLISDVYCDGLGACLPECPTGAITLEEREAAAFDESLVEAKRKQAAPLPCGCPGMHAKSIQKKPEIPTSQVPSGTIVKPTSQLRQWPVQIKLVPVNAPYLQGADLLVAADCSAFAYANIHEEFMKNKVTLIGCPKLDSMNYAEKLTQILLSNDIRSITVLRMEVPCCGGIVQAVKGALLESGQIIPWRAVTISTDGEILDDR